MVFLLTGIFSVNLLLSQVVTYEKYYSDSLIISPDNDMKTNVFIFIRKDNTNRKTNRLMDNLETVGIDSNLFNIHLISIITELVCPYEKVFILDGYDNLPTSFKYDPYYIIIKTDNLYIDSVMKARLDGNSLKKMSVIKDKKMKNSPFVFIPDDLILMDLIKQSDNTFDQIDSLKKVSQSNLSEIVQLKHQITTLKAKDSIRSSFLSFFLTPNFLNWHTVSVDQSVKLGFSRISNTTCQVTYVNYPFGILKNLGYGLGLGYSQHKGNVSIDKQDNSFVDTVQKLAYDPNGDPYTRIAYGKDIREQFLISFMSIITNLSYKFPLKHKRDIGFISVNPGLKISNILSSSYIATDGYMSYGGYYRQYNKEDTIFSGLYDFDQNKPVNKERRRLELNNSFVSTFVSIDLSISPFKQGKWAKFYMSCSLFWESGSNILYNHPKENKLSDNSRDYNSLLYRTDRLSINTMGFRLGLSYGF